MLRNRVGRFAVLCALLGSVLSTAASADPLDVASVPHVRMPRVPIPANGAIMLESFDGTEPLIDVTPIDGGTLSIPGEYREVGALLPNGRLYAWLPDEPFEPGAYSVAQFHPFDSSLAVHTEIEVVAALDGTPPAVASEPSVSAVSRPGERVCCRTPIADLVNHCAIVRETTVLQLEGGLTCSDPASKLNQYLFRYTAGPDSGDFSVEEWLVPFEQLPPVLFGEQADEYCFVLTAVNVATDEAHRYDELPSCAGRGDLFVGLSDVDPGPAFFDVRACPFPPDGFEERWCEINQGVCDGGARQDCEQYEHVCEDGGLPDHWLRDAGVPRVELEGDESPPADTGGDCTVHAPRHGSRELPVSGWVLAVLYIALVMRRTRR